MFGSIVDVFRWHGARKKSAAGDYHGALILLDKIKHLKTFPFTVDVYRADCHQRLGNYDLSLAAYLSARDGLLDQIGASKIVADDAAYMELYIRNGVAFAENKLNQDNSSQVVYNWNQIKLLNVSQRLKAAFPLPMHPDWLESDHAVGFS